MNDKQQLIVACVRDGMTIDQAAQEAGVPIATVRRQLTTGRKTPDGRYGAFARSVDAARLAVPQQSTGDRLAEVNAIAESLGNPDGGERARLGLARALARKIDWCEATPTGAAAMAMANLSKQYREVLEELSPPSNSDMEWLADVFGPPDDPRADEYRRALEAIGSSYDADEARRIARGALEAR